MEEVAKSLLETNRVQPELIQALWKGHGSVVRYSSPHGRSVVIKHVELRQDEAEADEGVERKRKSYIVERRFYEHFSARLPFSCRVPRPLAMGSSFLALEDLVEFPVRVKKIERREQRPILSLVVKWLAEFHAKFMGESFAGQDELWECGTYWALATRQQELAGIDDSSFLKRRAAEFDARLRQDDSILTFVHGDSKLANFCFSSDIGSVAGLDFQYVGRGCGVQEVVYLVANGVKDDNLALEWSDGILDEYFSALMNNLVDKDKIERMRVLVPYAAADYLRFLRGWAPHRGAQPFLERLVAPIIENNIV